MPRRPYGKAGIELSIIGFGGIVVTNLEQERANRLVAMAIEKGINYFDVAPTYGNAQERLGPALEPYRKDCFLACKTAKRERAAAEAEFKQSLSLLRTDHFDLFQLHAISDVAKDVDAVFAAGGLMDMLIAAKKAGQVRHLGFSAHSIEAATAALDRYDFDSVLFPVNFATYYAGNFGPQIMAKAMAKGASRLALKAMAKQQWPENHPDRKKYGKCWYQPLTDPHQMELALRFTLSQAVTAALPPGEEDLFMLAVEMGMRFRPLDEAGERELRKMAATLTPIFRAMSA